MSQSGLSAPASPDPDMSGSRSDAEGFRPESRSSISSNSMADQAAESSRFSSNADDADRKSDSGEVIGLDENAQSGGLLDEEKQEMLVNESSKDAEDSLEMVSDDEMEANDSFKGNSCKKSLAPTILDPLKDTELDFEPSHEGDIEGEETSKRTGDEDKNEEDNDEDGECDGGNVSNSDTEKDANEPEEGEELEEGEVSSEEDVGKHARMEPRPVCRFYSKGNCTWGNNCRFVHPGVLDKGNYNMFAPARSAAHNGPPPFERPFERPPPVMPMIPPAPEWIPPPRIANPRPPRSHPQPAEAPRADATGGSESAWERGLRQAKEMLKKSSHRKETDVDFEEKKLNLGLGEEDLDKENDYYTRPASPVLHGDVPPPFEEPEAEPYHKYPPHPHPPPSEGRWPSRYPPPPHRHPPPPGYPYPPYESRRPYPEPEFRERGDRERDREREREFYHHEAGYDRHYYGPKPGEREPHGSSSKSQPPLPPPQDKRWADERYVEVVPPTGRSGRSDEWWDPWMRSRSPGATGGGGGGTSGAPVASGGNSAAMKGSRRRSYSSGSSFSSSSSTSSSSSSSYSSSTSRSSSASSRSSSHSKLANAKRTKKQQSVRKHKSSEQGKSSNKIAPPTLPVAKHRKSSGSGAIPSMPSHSSSRKTSEKQRNITEMPSSKNRSPVKARPQTKTVTSVPIKSHGRARSSSASSSSSEWESSPHSNGRSRRNTSNRGRRDFAERKELRGGNSPPLPLQTSSRKTSEPIKMEVKQQIKLTLKSPAPPLKKLPNRFDDESDDEGWEKEKPAPANVPQPVVTTSSNQSSRKRSAESPPPAAPPPKVSAPSPQKVEKGGKKSAATRREELLKQLKAVEDAIAKKRSKLPT